jgi:hypothetical protein
VLWPLYADPDAPRVLVQPSARIRRIARENEIVKTWLEPQMTEKTEQEETLIHELNGPPDSKHFCYVRIGGLC